VTLYSCVTPSCRTQLLNSVRSYKLKHLACECVIGFCFDVNSGYLVYHTEIMQLINEMEQCVDRTIGIMSGKVMDTSNRRAPQDIHDGGQATFGDILTANPSRLWYAATLICRELVVGEWADR
jgi:hypothetical protein